MADSVALPPVEPRHDRSLYAALAGRRSVRYFLSQSLDLDAVGRLLWAAQGVTSPDGHRTAPSAGALFPLELDVVAGAVLGLIPGVYRYLPASHRLSRRLEGDRRRRCRPRRCRRPASPRRRRASSSRRYSRAPRGGTARARTATCFGGRRCRRERLSRGRRPRARHRLGGRVPRSRGRRRVRARVQRGAASHRARRLARAERVSHGTASSAGQG